MGDIRSGSTHHPGDGPILPGSSACAAVTEEDRWLRAADQLYRERRVELLAYARGCIRRLSERNAGNVCEAEDLLHDAVLPLMKGSISRYRNQAQPPTTDQLVQTVKATMSNIAKNMHRSLQKRSHEPLGQEAVAGGLVDGDQQAWSILLELDVARAILGLPAQRRIAVERCVIEDQEPADVAASTGKAAKTIRNYIDRAKPFLRTQLRSYRPESPTIV